jgi:hypothetical protein
MTSHRLAIPGVVCLNVFSSLLWAQPLGREQRVALLEMANHEFLDKNHRRERSTFADGTTVTIDRDARTFEIRPELKL